MEHIERPIFAHVPRWTTSRARAGVPLRRSCAPASAACDPLDVRTRQRLPPDDQRGARWRATSTSRPSRCWPATCCSSQGDRVAMANSIEGRFPYLDHRVIEFANRLPAELQDPGPDREVPAAPRAGRPAARGYLERTKQPYRAPDSAELLLRRRAARLRGRPARAPIAFARPATSTRPRSAHLFDKCRAGRATGFADNQAFVGILSTMLLDEHFVRRR